MSIQNQEFWVIRHKPSGKYLPEPAGRMGRGGSWVEPKSALEAMPRMMKSRLSAVRVLSAWLQGGHKAEWGVESEEYGGRTYHYQSGVDVVPMPNRIKAEMEIVKIEAVYTEVKCSTQS